MLMHACMLGWYRIAADKKRLSATPPSLETKVEDNASQDSLDFQASFGEPRPSWWPRNHDGTMVTHVYRDEFQGVDEWHLVDELTSRDVEFQGVPPGYEPHIKAETPVDFSQSKVKELARHHVDRSSKDGYQRRPFLSVSSSMESGPADCKQGCDCTVDSGPGDCKPTPNGQTAAKSVARWWPKKDYRQRESTVDQTGSDSSVSSGNCAGYRTRKAERKLAKEKKSSQAASAAGRSHS